jgi:hypothetical protein
LAVVATAVAEAGRRDELLVRSGCQRQSHLAGASGIQHEVEVLDKDVDGAGHHAVVLNHAWAAVLQHPARSGRASQDLERPGGVDTGLLRERETLRGDRNVHAREQLIDNLHRGALAGPFAEVMQVRTTHCLEDWPLLREKG